MIWPSLISPRSHTGEIVYWFGNPVDLGLRFHAFHLLDHFGTLARELGREGVSHALSEDAVKKGEQRRWALERRLELFGVVGDAVEL